MRIIKEDIHQILDPFAALTLMGEEMLERIIEDPSQPLMKQNEKGIGLEEQETYDLLCDTIEAVKNVPDGMGQGVYYWEPEVGKDLLPDKYPLGAAVLVREKTLRFTKAMTAYKKYNL